MLDLKYKFSGHQTFAFRYGWLEKGVRGVAEHSDLFSREDALVKLGVGKNMVSSIKHWCLATQLAEPALTVSRNGGKHLRPTDLAQQLLLGGDAWDPFLEDDASLWLIHWLLVSNASLRTIWQLLFSEFHRPDFTKRELISFIVGFAERHSLQAKESVIGRDVDCFLHTYVTGLAGKKLATPEEGFSCPLLELGIIQLTLDGELYRFAIGPKPSLPTAVFAFAMGEYFQRSRAGRRTMSIQDCLYAAGSPGQAFKLDENSLVEYVEDLEDATEGAVGLDETAGLKQIYLRREIDPQGFLVSHYGGGAS
ncbi:MAG: DUF4007 family protein [Lentisphaerae bacterium]|jgi:hypothetical protein|nr:DUF4007 family protein [Lentisphaerota bacterium]